MLQIPGVLFCGPVFYYLIFCPVLFILSFTWFENLSGCQRYFICYGHGGKLYGFRISCLVHICSIHASNGRSGFFLSFSHLLFVISWLQFEKFLGQRQTWIILVKHSSYPQVTVTTGWTYTIKLLSFFIWLIVHLILSVFCLNLQINDDDLVGD